MAQAQSQRGRPRGFTADAALDAAVRVFWANGYDGASVERLCRETRMPRASLYQDFGGKEALFLAAVGHYAGSRMVQVIAALGPKGSLAQDLASFYAAVVALATEDPATPGCLISCVLADAAGSNAAFRAELDRRYAALEARMADRLAKDGWTDRAAAGLAAAVARGLTLRARSGSTAEQLRPVAEAAVAALMALRGRAEPRA